MRGSRTYLRKFTGTLHMKFPACSRPSEIPIPFPIQPRHFDKFGYRTIKMHLIVIRFAISWFGIPSAVVLPLGSRYKGKTNHGSWRIALCFLPTFLAGLLASFLQTGSWNSNLKSWRQVTSWMGNWAAADFKGSHLSSGRHFPSTTS